MNPNYIIIIILIAIIVVLGVTYGIIYGAKEKQSKDGFKSKMDQYPYDNNNELIQEFPNANYTTVQPGLEEKIQNRLLTGYVNWNKGFIPFKEYGDVLYTKRTIYNVNGVILTSSHFQKFLNDSLNADRFKIGDIHNMIINDNFAAIYYGLNKGKDKTNETVMEFIQFKDYGKILGIRIVESWQSTKDENYSNLASIYQEGEDQERQKKLENKTLNYTIDMTEKNLTKRYPINFPIEYIDKEKAKIFIEIILNGFDKWNNNITDYLEWVNNSYSENATINIKGTELNKTEYINKIEEELSEEKENKTLLYFENILIRDNWTALHYRYIITNTTDNSTDFWDSMEFLFFKKEEDNNYTIDGRWVG